MLSFLVLANYELPAAPPSSFWWWETLSSCVNTPLWRLFHITSLPTFSDFTGRCSVNGNTTIYAGLKPYSSVMSPPARRFINRGFLACKLLSVPSYIVSLGPYSSFTRLPAPIGIGRGASIASFILHYQVSLLLASPGSTLPQPLFGSTTLQGYLDPRVSPCQACISSSGSYS